MPTELTVKNEKIADNLLLKPEELDSWFHQKFAEEMEKHEDNKIPAMTIIATKGTMDMAYPPFILASTAAALGWNVSIFFTFYGLELLKKDLQLKVSPLGNPAMPMKMPFGAPWFRDIEWKMPNLVMAGIPGFENLATGLMEKTLQQKGVAPIEELRQLCIESDVRLIACQMTMDLFGWKKEEFIDEVSGDFNAEGIRDPEFVSVAIVHTVRMSHI